MTRSSIQVATYVFLIALISTFIWTLLKVAEEVGFM